MSIQQGANLFLNRTKSAVNNIPVVGSVLGAYVGGVQDYINENLHQSLRYHPREQYIQQKEDVETQNIFDTSKNFRGNSGTLGPPRLSSIPANAVRMTNYEHAIRPNIVVYENNAKNPPMLPLVPVGNYNVFVPTAINPFIGVEKYSGNNFSRDFANLSSQRPNAAFATSGFLQYRTRMPRK